MKIKRALLAIVVALSFAAASFANSQAINSLYQLSGYDSGISLEIPQAVPDKAAPAGVRLSSKSQVIRLSDFKGYTFQQFMVAPNGMKYALDTDALERFSFVDKGSVNAMEASFDPAVYKKIDRSLIGGRAGLNTLVDSLSGLTATPLTAAGVIAGKLNELNIVKDPSRLGLTAVTIAPLLSLNSGAGVSVILDKNNSYLNIGYKSGKDPALVEKDVKSGRSFGIAPGHKALDVSDTYYLGELDKYLAEVGNPSAFYEALFNVILRCDPSTFSGLSPPGQTVATDFTAVYTAEIDRHAMTQFKKHPWENDLAEATLVSAYSSIERKVVVDGKFIDGSPINFFGVGVQGSGIGIMRKDRRILQRAVSNLERKLHPQLVADLEAQIGRKGGDVIHNLMVYINTPQNQASIRANSGPLLRAIVNFISQVHMDARAITDDVNRNGLPKTND